MRQSIIQSDPVSRSLEDRVRPPVRLAWAFVDRLPGEGRDPRGPGLAGSAPTAVDEVCSEGHWDAPLPLRVRLGHGPVLRTLRDVGDFLSVRPVMLEHSAAFRDTMQAVTRAARTGTPDDVAHAALRIQDYISRLTRKDERQDSQGLSMHPAAPPARFAPRGFRR